MSKTFVISDSHFFHKNIISFTNGDKPLRPFDTVEEMNEYMIEAWNSVVGPDDKVIHLGDVVFAQQGFECLRRLNGKKTLLLGNHERHKLSQYQEHFVDIRAYAEIKGFILSHIPVHTSQLTRWKGNIHGHLHSERVMMTNFYGAQVEDPRYFCASVEQIDYKPILLGEVFQEFQKRGVL